MRENLQEHSCKKAAKLRLWYLKGSAFQINFRALYDLDIALKPTIKKSF